MKKATREWLKAELAVPPHKDMFPNARTFFNDILDSDKKQRARIRDLEARLKVKDAATTALKVLVDLYVRNAGTKSEFVTIWTEASAWQERYRKQKKLPPNEAWVAWQLAQGTLRALDLRNKSWRKGGGK